MLNAAKAPLLASSADWWGLLLLLLNGLEMSLWKHGSDGSSWVLSVTINLASSFLADKGGPDAAQSKDQVGVVPREECGTVVLWVDGEGL